MKHLTLPLGKFSKKIHKKAMLGQSGIQILTNIRKFIDLSIEA